jgi:hypothetical protein
MIRGIGSVFAVIFGFTFVRYIICFLLGSVLGAVGMHDLLFSMWHQFAAILGIHGGIHVPSINIKK